MGSITIVLPHSAIDSHLTDIYLNENLQDDIFNSPTNERNHKPVQRHWTVSNTISCYWLEQITLHIQNNRMWHKISCRYLLWSMESTVFLIEQLAEHEQCKRWNHWHYISHFHKLEQWGSLTVSQENRPERWSAVLSNSHSLYVQSVFASIYLCSIFFL